jgi:uncharacterized protein (TIGR03382 family)
MQLQYSGVIQVPADEAWAALSDLNRVAACIPGVRLDQVSGDEVAGTVTVPLGPLRLTYRGEATFVERDAAARRVVIDAAGRDSHGEQAASARITAQLREEGDGATHVTAVADVSVRGMSAPVGFAVGEFGTGLLRQFVTRLGTAVPTAATTAPRPDTADAAEAGSAARGAAGARPSPYPKVAAAAAPAEAPAADPVTPARPGPNSSPENAVYPVPPPGEAATAMEYVPLAGSLAVGVLLGWLLGRRRRR